ncbi:MAG: hydrogenase maturation nickel metallochaperone HypA [Saprospiraceae bacterium]|nr:hydrogenase maturation nickel metallochaperone HypA [Saprospiraceae bacterium]
MHELSIAVGIVDLAEQEAAKAGGNNIESIELVVGKLSGVEIEALDFVWSSATEGTMLENAERITIQIKGKARCLECGNEYDIESLYENCPECNSYFKDIIQGKELQLKSITINEK